VNLYDDSFEQLVERGLPAMDFICLHGIYSWISPRNRQVIVHFIDRHLKPGGVVYVSYNALPGWAAAAPMRELMRLYGERMCGPSVPMLAKVKAAIDFLGDLKGRNMLYFQSLPNLDKRIERLNAGNPNYVAHEYLNREWHPQYFFEVAEEMSAARLTYACPGQLVEHIDVAMLPKAVIEHLKQVPDVILKETLRDFYLNQQFRRDLFTRGAARLLPEENLNRLLDQRWILITAPESIQFKLTVGSGEITLDEAAHKPVVEALADGPLNGRALMERPAVGALGQNRLVQALVLLTAAGYLQPMVPKSVAEPAIATTERFNAAVISQADDSELGYIACPLTGQAVGRARIGMMHMDIYRSGVREEDAMAAEMWKRLSKRGQRMVTDGKTLETAEENLRHLRELAAQFLRNEVPRLRSLSLI